MGRLQISHGFHFLLDEFSGSKPLLSSPLPNPRSLQRGRTQLSFESRVEEEAFKDSFSEQPSELQNIANNHNISIQHMQALFSLTNELMGFQLGEIRRCTSQFSTSATNEPQSKHIKFLDAKGSIFKCFIFLCINQHVPTHCHQCSTQELTRARTNTNQVQSMLKLGLHNHLR